MMNVQDILNATNGTLLNGNLEDTFNMYRIDSRLVEEGDFYIPLKGENADGHNFIPSAIKNGCKGLFVSIEMDLTAIIEEKPTINIIKVEDTLTALQDIGRYNREKHIDIDSVCITGSVGKTSTREMVASVLSQENELLVTKKNFNGHIGLPLMALEIEKQDLAVLEAGIDFVGEMDILGSIVKPDVVAITNIGTSHIGKFGTQDVIYNEKVTIAKYLKGKKVLILNRDDAYLAKFEKEDANIIYYGMEDAKNIVANENGIEFDTNIYGKEEHIVINAIGNHNILNALVAIRVAEQYNMKSENIIKGVASYQNFERRMQRVNLKDFAIIDDTYNASPSSTVSGLKTVDTLNCTRRIAVLADILELGDYARTLHEEMAEVFKDLHYDVLVTFGENMGYMAELAKQYVPIVYICNDAIEAEAKIREIKQEGDLMYFKGSNSMKVNGIVENLKRDCME